MNSSIKMFLNISYLSLLFQYNFLIVITKQSQMEPLLRQSVISFDSDGSRICVNGKDVGLVRVVLYPVTDLKWQIYKNKSKIIGKIQCYDWELLSYDRNIRKD
jgi:hypothetical protein